MELSNGVAELERLRTMALRDLEEAQKQIARLERENEFLRAGRILSDDKIRLSDRVQKLEHDVELLKTAPFLSSQPVVDPGGVTATSNKYSVFLMAASFVFVVLFLGWYFNLRLEQLSRSRPSGASSLLADLCKEGISSNSPSIRDVDRKIAAMNPSVRFVVAVASNACATASVSTAGISTVSHAAGMSNYVFPLSCLGYKLNEQINPSDTNIVSVQKNGTLAFDKYEMRCTEDFGGVRFETCMVSVSVRTGIKIIAATTTNATPEQFRLAVGRMNGLLGKPVVNENEFVSWNYSGGSLSFRSDRVALSFDGEGGIQRFRVFDLSFISDSLLADSNPNSTRPVQNNLFSRMVTLSGGLSARLPDGYSVTKREDDYIEISERDGTPSIFLTHEGNMGRFSAMAALLNEAEMSESFLDIQQKVESVKTEAMVKRGATSKIVRWGKPYSIGGLKAFAHAVDFVRQDRYFAASHGGDAVVFCTNVQILRGEDNYTINVRRLARPGTATDSPAPVWLHTFVESLSFP